MNIRRKPEWLKINLSAGSSFSATRSAISANGVHTVCQSAKCPNLGECWARGSAAFMILGENCTRACRFCAVSHNTPLPPDPNEPARVAAAIKEMKLKHAALTSVTRDDLADGGARHWASVIQEVRKENPDTKIEVLVPDFCGDYDCVQTVLNAIPDIFNHNLETVEALQKSVRGKADYKTSLKVLRYATDKNFKTKSGIMLGLGESESDIKTTLRDLRGAGVSILTIGQYIAPSAKHFPIARWVTPAEFAFWKDFALALGFAEVHSSPLTRSSRSF